jgi:hypothetical protein
MFSVPEVIEIRAPAESANHSSGPHPFGQIQRGDHPCAFRPRQRVERLRRVAEQHDPGDTFAMLLGGRGHDTRHDRRVISAFRPIYRRQRAGVVEIVLDEAAAGAGEQVGQLIRVDVSVPSRA